MALGLGFWAFGQGSAGGSDDWKCNALPARQLCFTSCRRSELQLAAEHLVFSMCEKSMSIPSGSALYLISKLAWREGGPLLDQQIGLERGGPFT